MENYIPILIFLFFLLIILSGVFTLFDSSLNICRRARLEKENEKKYKAVLKTFDNPRRILIACRMCNTVLRVLLVFCAINIYYFFWHEKYRNIYLLIASLIILGIIITLLCDTLPRLLSHTRPEKITAAILPVMKFFSIFMMPFALPVVKFIHFFNKKVRPEIDDSGITEEELQDELRNTLIEGEKSGVVESGERGMVEGVFYLGDRSVGAFMTHRSEIQWLDINSPYEEIKNKAIEFKDQRCFPVVNASPDEIIGAVYVEDIILDYSSEKRAGLRAIMKKAQFVPETMPAIKAFESFKQSQSNFLFVMDEYGGLSGIISITALVEEIVGELSVPVAEDPPLLLQEDGTYLADGTLNIDDVIKELSLTISEECDYHTLAGLVLHLAEELPHVGDSFNYQGYNFKVVDKDGNRIDKLLIRKI